MSAFLTQKHNHTQDPALTKTQPQVLSTFGPDVRDAYELGREMAKAGVVPQCRFSDPELRKAWLKGFTGEAL